MKSTGNSLPATLERALLCVAYDTMGSRIELVALELKDFSFLPDGTGCALIRRSKTDQAGEGDTAYLSRTTVRYLKLWLDAAGITGGAVFRRVIGRGTVTTVSNGRGRIGERLSVDAVAQAFKRVAEWVKMPPEDVAGVSGHSIRVGATQDLLALKYRLGLGDSRRTVEDEPDADAGRGACIGRPRWDGADRSSTRERRGLGNPSSGAQRQ